MAPNFACPGLSVEARSLALRTTAAMVAAVAMLLAGCSGTTTVVDAGALFPVSDAGPTQPLVDGGTGKQGPGAIAIPGDAAYNTWTWHSIDGTFCGNGSGTGIGVNPRPQSKGLLIFLNGGGACYDNDSCFTNPIASFLNGFGAFEFALGVSQAGNAGLFDRSNAANPFKDFDFVFVPYCTGDLHAGTHVQTYASGSIHHVGHQNLVAILQRAVPTFPSPAQVVIAGSSAGGFGAVFNYELVRSSFPGTSPFLVDDSGPLLRPPYLSTALQQLTSSVWGVTANLPSGCTLCLPTQDPDTGYHQLWKYEAAAHADFRGALISSLWDGTIRSFFSRPPGDADVEPCATDGGACPFADGLQDFDAHVASTAGPGIARVYYLPSTHHTWLGGDLSATVSNGVTLADFLSAGLAPDAGWASVKP